MSHTDPVEEGGRRYEEQVDFNLINNAIILYVIAQREGQVVARNKFNEEALIEAIKKYISPRIANSDDVAHEIYKSWFELQRKQQFIRNVSEGRVKVDKSMVYRGLSLLTEIPNFEQFLQGLINCYLNTVANGQNIQEWSLQQSLQLFLSTKAGHAFDQNKAEILVKAANIIEKNKHAIVSQHQLSPNKAAEVAKKLNNLQELLMKETGEWLTTLKGLIENDITNIVEDLTQEKLNTFKIALNNLLEGKYDSLSSDAEINNALKIIKDYLTADESSPFYQSTVQRDKANNKPLPSIELFRAGIRLAIRRAANENKIQLNQEQIFVENNASGEVQAVASAPAAAVNLPASSAPVIATAQLMSQQNNPFGQYHHLLEKEIQKLFHNPISGGTTAQLVCIRFNAKNCRDATSLPFINKYFGEEGAGYQLVFRYHDGQQYRYSWGYYPLNQYQTIPALLASFNLDWATLQLRTSNLENQLDIHIHDYHFTKDILEFQIKGKNGELLQEIYTVPLSAVWDSKKCIFNNLLFQLLKKEKTGLHHINAASNGNSPDSIQFPRIHSSEILNNYKWQDCVTKITSQLPRSASDANITFNNSDIFEHGLLKLAGIDGALMTLCKFYPSQDANDNFYIVEFKMRDGNINEFKNALNKQFGLGTVESHYSSRHGGTAFRIPYGIMIEDLLPEWKKAVDKLLSSHSTVKAYQCAINNRKGIPTFEQICDKYRQIGSPYKLDIGKSNYIVATLLKFVNLYSEEVKSAPITIAEGQRMSGTVCMDLYLDLPLDKVKQFIDTLNKLIPSAAAELINEDTEYKGKPGKYRQVSIDRDAFAGSIAEKVAETLKKLQVSEPQFIDTYQKQSGTYVAPPTAFSPPPKDLLDFSSANKSTFWSSEPQLKKAAVEVRFTAQELVLVKDQIVEKLKALFNRQYFVFESIRDNIQSIYFENNPGTAFFQENLIKLKDKGLDVELTDAAEFGIDCMFKINHSVETFAQKLGIDLNSVKLASQNQVVNRRH